MYLDPSLARVIHAERAAQWLAEAEQFLSFSTGLRAAQFGRRSVARWSASAPGLPSQPLDVARSR